MKSHSEFQKQRFESVHVRRSGMVSGLSFVECTFQGCSLGLRQTLADRLHVTNVELRDCIARGCSIGPVVFEDVVIDGLNTPTMLQFWGPVLRHVTLRGRIGRIMVSQVHDVLAETSEQRAWLHANGLEYQGVDWALDIANADFEEADLRGVPGHLVRRDPETQVLVKRERLFDGHWRSLDLDKTWWQTTLQAMLDESIESEVLVAPRLDPRFDDLVSGLRLLQKAGIAEPD